jgi:hypothetical protein
MFGFNKMTQSGAAKVVSCNPKLGGMSSTDSKGRSSCAFNVILDVYPDGAQPFRAETKHWFSELRFPDPGDTLKVRCNPEKKRVKIDLTGDERFNPKIFRKENEEQQQREHDELLKAPPGTPVPDEPGADENLNSADENLMFDRKTGMIIKGRDGDGK